MMKALPTTMRSDPDERHAWASSGMRALTGPEERPGLGPPAGFVGRLDQLTQQIAEASGRIGRPVVLDGLVTLAERARIARLRRHGTVSCGGGTHLVAAADGWFAVSLARAEDIDLLPAWLGADLDPTPGAVWDVVPGRCRERPISDLVDRGVLLGLPVAALGSQSAHERPPAITTTVARPDRTKRTDRPFRVADLSALWAGPLCGRILAAAGAEVTKIESTSRPDGARRGPEAFFELLNGDKRHVAIDLTSPGGLEHLLTVLRASDVVIESSRPRSLRQLGVDADALLAESDGPRVWLSITGHGRDDGHGHRVAFGDDAAVAGGLVSWSGGQPFFCGDAIADPLSGLAAATATLAALARDERVLVDVSMAATAAHFAGATRPAGPYPAARATAPVDR
jgi:hypothetical protein